MIYYLILPGQSESDLFDHSVIGETSVNNTFYTGIAYNVLKRLIINDQIDILNQITIKDSSNKIWSIDSFFNHLKQYTIILLS